MLDKIIIGGNMKKFLLLSLCFVMCLSSFLVLSACKKEEKPTPVAQAEQAFATAMSNMATQTCIKMSSPNFLFMGEFIMIASNNGVYTKMDMLGTESWTQKESDQPGAQWYEYAITNDGTLEEPNYKYIKQLYPYEYIEKVDTSDFGFDIFDMLENSQFASASKLNGELSILYTIENEGTMLVLTIKVTNNMISSISMGAMGITMTINFEFGEQLLSQIPEIPEKDWVELEAKIEIDELDFPTEFVVDETLNLEDIQLEFYTDKTKSYDYDMYDITIDMISGFDTSTATQIGESRTMTITFCGLTYDIEYTVIEAPAVS
jgi:hypothetical protein